MPELPEVEVLMRHLAPVLKNQTVRKVANDKAITPDYQTVKALSDYLEAQMGK